MLDPGVGFEPTWDFSACLQGKCNQPLCEPGIYFNPIQKEMEFAEDGGIEPHPVLPEHLA